MKNISFAKVAYKWGNESHICVIKWRENEIGGHVCVLLTMTKIVSQVHVNEKRERKCA